MKETVEEYLKRGGKITAVEYDEEAIKRNLKKYYIEQMKKLKKRK